MWPLFALTSGALQATQDALTKRTLNRGADRYFLAVGVFLVGSIIPFALSIAAGMPPLSGKFWLAVAATGILNVIAFQILYHTLAKSDLSLAMPMLAFSPAFNIVMARLIVGDRVSLIGALGVFLVVAGSYVLHSEPGEHIWTPLRTIVTESVSRNMLFVALLFSASMPFNKMATLDTNPVTAAAWIFLFIGLATIPLTIARRERPPARSTLVPFWPPIVLIGVVFALSALAEYYALTLGAVPYVMSVKRLSIIFAILYGWWWFGEQFALRRSIDGAIMIAGHATIILGA